MIQPTINFNCFVSESHLVTGGGFPIRGSPVKCFPTRGFPIGAFPKGGYSIGAFPTGGHLTRGWALSTIQLSPFSHSSLCPHLSFPPASRFLTISCYYQLIARSYFVTTVETHHDGWRRRPASGFSARPLRLGFGLVMGFDPALAAGRHIISTPSPNPIPPCPNHAQ